MNFPSLEAVREFTGFLKDPEERLRRFCPLTLKPWDLSRLLDKMEGIYDLPAERIPANTVLIGSRVLLVDLLDFSEREFEVVLPEYSDPGEGRVSVLSPLGASALGLEYGETFCVWIGNRIARYRIKAISQGA